HPGSPPSLVDEDAGSSGPPASVGTDASVPFATVDASSVCCERGCEAPDFFVPCGCFPDPAGAAEPDAGPAAGPDVDVEPLVGLDPGLFGGDDVGDVGRDVGDGAGGEVLCAVGAT